MPMIRDKASLLSELMVGKIYGADGKTGFFYWLYAQGECAHQPPMDAIIQQPFGHIW
jgi:hypothetical protein